MKKILVLNGSPKGNNSYTMYMTNAFLRGLMESNQYECEIINLNTLNIIPCKGCLSCWGRTKGSCVIKNDDIFKIKKKIEESDIFIESYPLYFFGMPGAMKAFTDRMMMMMSTYSGQRAPENGQSYHGIRNPRPNQKFIVISSCAYTDTIKAYEALAMQYNCICGKNNYTPIFCSQVKTLVDLKNEAKIERFFKKFYEAGIEFSKNNELSLETIEKLQRPPFSDMAYKVFLDKFWENEENNK